MCPENIIYFHRNVTKSPFENHKLYYFVHDLNKELGSLEKIKDHTDDIKNDRVVFDPTHNYPGKSDIDYIQPITAHSTGFNLNP